MTKLFLTIWTWVMTQWRKFKMMLNKTTETPLKPLPMQDSLNSIQQAIRAGLSYRAIARAFGVTKAQVKSLKVKATGRFYFASKTLDHQSNKTLRAELFNPVNGQTSRPPRVPVFYSAPQAWDWLKHQRLLSAMDEDPAQQLENIKAAYQTPLDLTPASH
jgi:hypothetical protein